MTMTDAETPATPRTRARFHTLRVADVRPLTPTAIEVTFAVPEELAEAFDYAPGQYVALRARVDGQDLRRSYSLCRPPVAERSASASSATPTDVSRPGRTRGCGPATRSTS